MKYINIALSALLLAGSFASCADQLNVQNPNQSTTEGFGSTTSELNEMCNAMYNRLNKAGAYGREGYVLDVIGGDEVWNSSQVWWITYDEMNTPTDCGIRLSGSLTEIAYLRVNPANFIIKYCDESTTERKRILGQAYFMRGLAYYELANYLQTFPLVLDYDEMVSYSSLTKESASYDEILDQVEADFAKAMELLPTKAEGGEWATGRANQGAAAGYYARALMTRHKYSEALTVLRNIINGQYGSYKLMANYGDNFREGSAYENNDESLFEIQFLDYGKQGSNHEWTVNNISKDPTQGHAIETVFAIADIGGWNDMSASPWLYDLFKQEKTTTGSLDPRLYWTLGTYEPEWSDFEYGNVAYGKTVTGDDLNSYLDENPSNPLTTRKDYGGIPIAKYTGMRQSLYQVVVAGLTCGINLRLMRYSDVLLRAAECINEISGPTDEAFGYINQVRNRAGLANLDKSKFDTADKLFEQIANVERPKEFGTEMGRRFDLLRWGFFTNDARINQLKAHAAYKTVSTDVKELVTPDMIDGTTYKTSYAHFLKGHEYTQFSRTTSMPTRT